MGTGEKTTCRLVLDTAGLGEEVARVGRAAKAAQIAVARLRAREKALKRKIRQGRFVRVEAE